MYARAILRAYTRQHHEVKLSREVLLKFHLKFTCGRENSLQKKGAHIQN